MDCLPDISIEEVEEVLKEPADNNIKEVIDDEDDNEDIMVELEKPKLSQAQIFQTPIIKKVIEPKKKRVLTEEHKAKLAVAREKALATRRANAAIKKETKDLEKKVKTNKLNKLRKEADEPIDDVEQEVPQPIKPINPIQSVQSNISQKDLEAVALNAIIGHEKIRKARKKKKKEEEEIIYQQNLLKQQLSNVMNNKPIKPQYSQNGVWDDFF
tara:strand:+ start:116 stop:754 length:639 start_codon:yes stop_codon:yes gene_type:complete